MKLLKQVKIFGMTFDVEYCDFDGKLQVNDYTGNCINRKQKIQIDTDSHPEHQKITLLHEILHLLSHNLDLEFNEKTVKCLSAGLYQVLKDNDLFAKEKGIDEQYDVEPGILNTRVRIRDESLNPIDNALVTLHREVNESHPVIAAYITGSDGCASFSVRGDYYVRVTKPGCKFKNYDKIFTFDGSDWDLMVEHEN